MWSSITTWALRWIRFLRAVCCRYFLLTPPLRVIFCQAELVTIPEGMRSFWATTTQGQSRTFWVGVGGGTALLRTGVEGSRERFPRAPCGTVIIWSRCGVCCSIVWVRVYNLTWRFSFDIFKRSTSSDGQQHWGWGVMWSAFPGLERAGQAAQIVFAWSYWDIFHLYSLFRSFVCSQFVPVSLHYFDHFRPIEPYTSFIWDSLYHAAASLKVWGRLGARPFWYFTRDL